MSKETRDSWWDSGPVYIVFGLVSLFILSMGLFHWPHNDISAVAAKTSGWFKVLGVVLYVAFVGLFAAMATDRTEATVGKVIVCFLAIALSLCSFCGFWYGNY